MRFLPYRRPTAWNGSLALPLSVAIAILVGFLLVQLSPLEGAALVGLTAVVVGTMIEPLVGLGVALFVGPLKAYLSANVPQVPAQVGHVFVALALGSWLMRGLSERRVCLRDTISPLFLSLFAFLGAALLSAWDAVDLAAYGLPELIKWAEIILVFLFVKEHLVANTPARPADGPASGASTGTGRHVYWLMAALLGSGVLQALVGIWQFGLRGEGPDHFRILGGDFFRAYGTFEQPNPYAGYLGLTTALAVGTVIGLAWDRLAGDETGTSGRSSRGRGKTGERTISLGGHRADLLFYLLGGVASMVMFGAMIASWSRGAWLGFGAATMAIAAALPRRMVWSVVLVAALVIGGMALYLTGQLPAPLAARLTTFAADVHLEDVRGVPINDANYAVIERIAHWQAALSMVRHNLWTGVGLGCYEAAYPTFALINWPMALGHAHNIYLNVAAETGLIGLAAYSLLWAAAFWQTWRVTRRARGLERGLSVGLFGAWTHLTVHHLLDNLYVNNVHLHVGVLLGLTAFLMHRANRTTLPYDR